MTAMLAWMAVSVMKHFERRRKTLNSVDCDTYERASYASITLSLSFRNSILRELGVLEMKRVFSETFYSSIKCLTLDQSTINRCGNGEVSEKSRRTPVKTQNDKTVSIKVQ